jgi:hypothetical protein
MEDTTDNKRKERRIDPDQPKHPARRFSDEYGEGDASTIGYEYSQ